MAGDDDATFPIRPEETESSKLVGSVHTDVVVGVVFFACMVGMAALAVAGSIFGDTHRLTHGRNYHGDLCGVGEMSDKPYLYFCGFLGSDKGFPTHLNYQSRSCVEHCPTNNSEMIACVMPPEVNVTLLGPAVHTPVKFDSTFDVQVTQSVAYQQSYPTQPHLDRYCVPKQVDFNDLHSRVLNGPLKQVSQFNSVVESFKHGWPVVLVTVFVATFMGLVYLYVLRKYAGILLYYTLWFGCVVSGIFGLYFMLGLFMDPYNELGWYQKSSVIFVACSGPAARLLSALAGFVAIATCVCLGFSAKNERIDDTIGLIDAACECILGKGSHAAFIVQPVTQAVAGSFFLLVILFGYMQVASLTEVDHRLIYMNDVLPVEESYARPLVAIEKRAWYMDLALHFYTICAIWFFLFFLAFCQYVITYAVATWFFEPCAENDDEETFSPGKRVQGLRLRGVDTVSGTRSGYLRKFKGEQVIMLPVGTDKLRAAKSTNKDLNFCIMTQAIWVGLWYHLGTMAIAGVMTAITFPFRMLSEMFKTFTNAAEGYDETDRSYGGLAVAGLSLFSTFLDEVFGRYSKNLLADVVLRSTDFQKASADSYDFVVDAGGMVALLHGVTGNYEVVGVIVITAISTAVAYFMVTSAAFGDPSRSATYVPSPGMVTLFCSALSCMIASGFMGLVTLATDGLLYAFLYARTSCPGKLEGCLPYGMKSMLSNEIEAQPAMALQAAPRSRLARFSHAASKYGDTVMSTLRGGTEGRRLLSTE